MAGQINKEFKKDRRCGVIVLPLPDVRERGCIAEKSPYLWSFLLFEKLNRVCHALLLKGWIVSVMLYPDLTIARFYEYYGAAEPPVRCGESHLSGLTEPPHFIY